MFVIKNINESEYLKKQVYLHEKDLYNGLSYCCNEEKSDLLCAGVDTDAVPFSGCSQVFCHGSIQEQLDMIYNMIIYLNRVYRTDTKALLKHRVISFEREDLLSVEEICFIAQQLIDWYALMGFPGVYGVHLNTDNTHIHLQIGTVNYFNGNRIHIDFEKILLSKITGYWYKCFYERLLADPAELERRLMSFDSAAGLSLAEAVNRIRKNLTWIDKRLNTFRNMPNAYPEGFVYSF